ncbi:MAG: hypothetical protein ACR2ND_08175 [Solirubrobacteraceae bacterium]
MLMKLQRSARGAPTPTALAPSGRFAVDGRRAPQSPEPDRVERRMRRSSAPLDRAHYGCDCGHHFTAPVATAVACPRCGGGQAW